MRLIGCVLFTLAFGLESAHAAEWILYSVTRSEPNATTWTMAETVFTEEAKCQTAAQALAQEQKVQTLCKLRVWRIYWHSAPRPIPPGRMEVLQTPRGRVGVLNERGEADIQRTERTTLVFDTEPECRAQLSKMRPPCSDVPFGDCTFIFDQSPLQ